ncbi:hypothetical protein BTVI_70167 [Pitangus sulphuratus]|nr:hypothetical protein BTVI_70167 [Pitangus sulphuratus]
MVSREFADARENRPDARSAMNRHNNEAGRTVWRGFSFALPLLKESFGGTEPDLHSTGLQSALGFACECQQVKCSLMNLGLVVRGPKGADQLGLDFSFSEENMGRKKVFCSQVSREAHLLPLAAEIQVGKRVGRSLQSSKAKSDQRG